MSGSNDYRELMMTNAEEALTHLTTIAPKSVVFTALQGVGFACSGPKCTKRDGAFPYLHAEATAPQDAPLYTELLCKRCGATYLVSWGYKDVPVRVERRGWRDILSDGSYGRLHGREMREEEKTTQ